MASAPSGSRKSRCIMPLQSYRSRKSPIDSFDQAEILYDLPTHVDVQSGQDAAGCEVAAARWYHHLRDHCDGWKKIPLLGQRELHAEIEILGATPDIGHPTYLLFFVEKVLSDSKFEPVG